HRKVDVFENSAFSHFDRAPALERTSLPVPHLDIPAPRRFEEICPGGKLRQLISTLRVGHCGGGPALVFRAPFLDADLHPPQRLTRVRANHAGADGGSSDTWV